MLLESQSKSLPSEDMWCLVRGPSATSSEFVKRKNVHLVIGFGGFNQRSVKITATGEEKKKKTTAVSAGD